MSCVCDDNGTPISVWTRATTKLIPNPDSDDSASDYKTFDRDLIERAPIIQKYRTRKATTILKEDCQSWTDTFKDANNIVWEQLFQMLGVLYVWDHSKENQILRNDGKANRKISMSLFGENIVFFWSERQKK